MLEGKDRDSQSEHSTPEEKNQIIYFGGEAAGLVGKTLRQISQPMDQEYNCYRKFAPPNILH